MYSIIFDLDNKIEPHMRKERAAIATRSAERALLTSEAEDEFKAYHKLRTLCKREDYFDTGYIDLEQLTKVLIQIGVREDKAVIQEIFDTYDTEAKKKISIKKFCDGIMGRRLPPTRVPGLTDLMAQVRNELLYRGLNSIQGLSHQFRSMDRNGDYVLSFDEFKRAITRYGVELNEKQLADVFASFDANKDGKICPTEFLTALRGKLNNRRERLVALAFKQLDKSHKGIVTFSELCGIYDASRHPDVVKGLRSKEDVLVEFISSWDRNGDGDVTLDEFMDYYQTVSCSIDNDDYFELMLRNAWHLAGGEGQAANTSNLRVLTVKSDGSQEVVCVENDLGLNKRDRAAIRARLAEQGVNDVVDIKLTM